VVGINASGDFIGTSNYESVVLKEHGLGEHRQHVEEQLQAENHESSLQPPLAGQEHEQEQSVRILSGRIPDIQEYITSILSRNYELHEYPYPRLFFVLPKEIHDSSEAAKPLAGQFRLYFQCECGAHTMPGDSSTFHQVHLAIHKGYDIVKPVEFFGKYGRYVLMQMYMIKHGIRVAGLVVPSLTKSEIAEELDMTQEHLESLVDDNIRFLQDLVRGTNEGSVRLDKVDALDGGERRRLEWYLDIKDGDYGFGNLYRIITHKGHVKWVCKDHYITSSPDSTMEELRMGVGASFRPDLREIRRRCYKDFDAASTIRNKTVNARGIQTFKITIEGQWGGVRYDQLPSIITSTNTVDLALDGLTYSCKQYECDPIMQTMSNGKLQSLRFLSSQDMAWAIKTSSITKAPKMRVLELQMPLDVEIESGMSYLGRILACCPNLVYLGLRLKEQVSLVKVMTSIVLKLKRLERLELYYNHFYTAADISHCKIKALQMHLPFTKHRDFVDAQLTNYTDDLDESSTLDQLVEILRRNPAIDDIKLGYRELDPLDMVNTTVTTRQGTPSKGNRVSPQLRLELISVWDPLCVPSTSIRMEFAASGMESGIRIGQWEPIDSAMYINFFRNYGWSIKTLDVMNGAIDDSLAQLLDKSTEDKGSKLKMLVLDLKSLSIVGLQAFDRVIRRSQEFDDFAVSCMASDIEGEGEKTRWFLEQHSNKLTRLCLQAYDPEDLTVWLEQVLPSRRVLSRLIELQLLLHGSPEFQQLSPFVQWLSGMVSAPPSKASHISRSDSLSEGAPVECSDGSSSADETWTSLQRLYLNEFKPFYLDWNLLLRAVDFSVLEQLDLSGANLSLDRLNSLAYYIGRVETTVPLKVLNLSDTPLSRMDSIDDELSSFERIKRKAPFGKIIGLSHLGIH